MRCFQRTNAKEKSQGQELTGTEVARKIAKESERGLKKGDENDTQQCQEVERVKQKGDKTIPNNAVMQREQELRKGREIHEKKRTTELPKSIPVMKQCKDSRIIHQVSH